MDISQIILVGMALVFACALQGAVGFGAGLFAIPLMLWAGETLPSAIVITLGGIAVQCGWNLYRYRGHVTVRELMPLLLLRVTTLPVGVAMLVVLVGMGTVRVKQVVGLMLLLALGIQWLLKVKPRQRVGWGWTVLAGTSSGLTAGLVGMGGPPVVLWVMAHDWPAKKSRAFLWATFMMLIPFNLSLLVYKFGSGIWGSLLLGLCLAPLIIAGSELGQRVGGLMNRYRLRSAALLLLLLLALVSILGPVLNLAG
jgi:uncharacterized protein